MNWEFIEILEGEERKMEEDDKCDAIEEPLSYGREKRRDMARHLLPHLCKTLSHHQSSLARPINRIGKTKKQLTIYGKLVISNYNFGNK